MKKSFFLKFMVFLLVLLMIFGLFHSDWLNKKIYPIEYKTEIKEAAHSFELDPLFIAAIIRVESHYKLDAVSHKGARGLMQLMPKTAQWIIDQGGFHQIKVDQLNHLPKASIMLGSWYIHHLQKQFDNQMVVALAAYNAGPNRVQEWLKSSVWDGQENSIENIPYGETKRYIRKVLHYYKKYAKIYKNEF